MKNLLRLLMIAATVCFVLHAPAITPETPNRFDTSDKGRSELLPGSWDFQIAPDHEFLASAWFTFRNNGTFESEGVLKVGKDRLRLKIEGTWRIVDGFLVETVTKSEKPEIIPVGAVTKDRILHLAGSALETRNEDGETEHFSRRKQAP